MSEEPVDLVARANKWVRSNIITASIILIVLVTSAIGTFWKTLKDGDKLRSTVMRWGFPMEGHNPGTNARNLSLGVWKRWAADPDYRCLVPVSAFCEFGPKAPGMKAAPQHWFGVVDQPVFFFGGFWRPDDDDRRFTLVTTGYLADPDNHVVGRVHPKAMPLILHREDLDRWLTVPFDELLEMQTAYPSQLMRVE
jgi:putative SOS response-associated peptidase YedK